MPRDGCLARFWDTPSPRSRSGPRFGSGYHSAGELSAVWALLTRGYLGAVRVLLARAPAISLRPWTRRDTLALCLVFVLVALLCGQPFRKVGLADPDGTRAYRAYFTMDFFWHTALVAEVSKFTNPPRNPFWASEPLHYYWTYFLVPSAVIGNVPARLGLRNRAGAAHQRD